MAHHTTDRRNLAAPDPNPSMAPTHKKQPKSTLFPTTTKPRRHPPDPDPTIASSTIHTISNYFSKLHTNHHKAPNPPSKPQINTNLQAKPMSISSIEDTPSKTITKSSHQRRKTLVEIEKEKLRAAITGATIDKNSKESREGCEINLTSGKAEKVKKLSTRGKAKNESHEGCDIKREYESLTRSQDGYDLKGRPSFSLAMSGGRRRSFCNPQTKLADFFSCNGVRVVSVDMPPFMQVHAVDSARKTHDSLEKFTAKTLASSLKREFDGVYGPAWHCIVGSSFGSFVTHSAGGFLYFSMDHKLYILLFKTAVQRAD